MGIIMATCKPISSISDCQMYQPKPIIEVQVNDTKIMIPEIQREIDVYPAYSIGKQRINIQWRVALGHDELLAFIGAAGFNADYFEKLEAEHKSDLDEYAKNLANGIHDGGKYLALKVKRTFEMCMFVDDVLRNKIQPVQIFFSGRDANLNISLNRCEPEKMNIDFISEFGVYLIGNQI